jgi:hypothetical protein
MALFPYWLFAWVSHLQRQWAGCMPILTANAPSHRLVVILLREVQITCPGIISAFPRSGQPGSPGGERVPKAELVQLGAPVMSGWLRASAYAELGEPETALKWTESVPMCLYIRDLIRREQERGAQIEAVRAALIEGEKSGKPKRFNASAFKRKLHRAHGPESRARGG